LLGGGASTRSVIKRARIWVKKINPDVHSVFNGFGIRMRPGFRLYNVSGLDAVELRLTNGEVRRLGTDDAAGFAAALKS